MVGACSEPGLTKGGNVGVILLSSSCALRRWSWSLENPSSVSRWLLFPCFSSELYDVCHWPHHLVVYLPSSFAPLILFYLFQAAVTSILLYGCTTWTLTKRLEKKLDGNYTRMLRAILNKSWWQHPTRHQLYGHLPPITKTIQVRRTRYAGHCWRSRDELIRHVLLLTPTHGHAKAGRPARTYIQQLCEDTGCCPEHLPWAMNDKEEWRERVRDIRDTSAIWWWWHLFPSHLSVDLGST